MFSRPQLEERTIAFFRYPLFWVSLSLVGGFALQHFFTLPLPVWFGLVVIFFGLQVLWYRDTRFFWFFLVFWMAVGAGIHFWSLDYPLSRFRSWDGRTLSLTGYVVEKDGRYFLSRIEGFSVYSPSLLLRGKDLGSWVYSRVVLRGVFRKFASCANPGGVDLRLRWWKERVMGYLEVREGSVIPGRSPWFTLLRWVKEKEERFFSVWRQELRDETPLFAALFLGKKDSEFFRQKDFFERMGIYHLFCVSGFHMTLLGGILLGMLGKFLPFSRRSSFLVLGFTFLYLLFCGLVPSAFRAFLMFGFYLLGKRLGRRIFSEGILWVAFLLMMVLQPEILLDAGAQLSFASTGGLIVFMHRFQNHCCEQNVVFKRIGENFLMGLAVYSVSLPFLIVHGFSFSSLFFLGNLVILPMTGGILFLSFLGVPLTIFPALLRPFATLLRFLLQSISFLVQFFVAHVPHLFLNFARSVDRFWGIWLFLGVLSLSLSLIIRNRVKILVYMLFIPAFVAPFFLQPSEEFWVFDVGQGLACGIVAGDSFAFIDVGGTIRGYGPVGETILEKFLLYRGIEYLDLIFLTHWHQDHAGNLHVFASPSAQLQVFAPENTSERGTPFIAVREPASFRLGDRVVIWGFPVTGETANDRALVYRIVFPGARVLITGDIEEGGIDALLRYGKSIEAEVVVLPHHGKYYPNLAELLLRTRCHTVIISCGENNYGHPNPEVLALVRRMGLRCFITWNDGAVRFWNFWGKWRVKSFGKRNL